MRLKTNLHFHTGDDPFDSVPYSTREGIDRAAALGFQVLALTCHRKAAWTPEYAAYAAEIGILLVPGIELEISESAEESGRHLILLNGAADAESLRTFSDLAAYRAAHPECFVLAAHPFFYGNFSLQWRLERHIHLFDAIEHSWFYSRVFNRNKKAERVAATAGLPMIATSDAHTFRNLNTDYAIVDAREKTLPALFQAIRKHHITNVTHEKKIFWGMAFPLVVLMAKNFLYRRSKQGNS